MLSELDDLLTHQTLETHDRVAMDDPRWTERFIFEVHDPGGELLVFCGLGIYPNTRYLDGFALCWHDGRHRNLRAGRERGADLWRLGAGPLRFEIVEPMRAWRLGCDDAGAGFAFELTFTARTRPFQMPTMTIERDGALLVAYSHFVQAGTYGGWVEVEGRRIAVAGWTGERDRSWGVRPPSARTRRGLHTWLPIQFDDVSVWVWTHENARGERTGLCGAVRRTGADPPPPVPVTDYRADLDIDLVGHHRVLRGGRLVIDAADGERLAIDVEAMPPLLSLHGGGYGGARPQGTPGGALEVESEVWDHREPGALERVPHSILEHACRFRWGERVGHGCFELCVGEYAPKGFPPVD
jgi:hypothetical protein